MIPIESVRLKRARQLVAGEFAILKDYSDACVLIGTINEFTVAVFLEPESTRCNTVAVEDLSGAALVIEEFDFYVDHESWEKLELMDNRTNSLVVSGNKVSIAAVPPSNQGYVVITIRQVEHEGSEVSHAFRRWQLVLSNGEHSTTLFEKSE